MKKNSQFLHNLIAYSLTFLACSFFFPYPHWLSIKHFTSLPDFCSFFLNPRCFFLVGNTIILFLVREWKLLGSLQSPAAEIYDKYAARSPASGQVPASDLQEGIKEILEMEKEKNFIEKCLDKAEDEEEKDGHEEEEEQPGRPAEELNKRIEEFIARINKQRWLEAKLLVYDDNTLDHLKF